MKFKLLFAAVFASLLLIVLAMAVMAQEEPPAPYTGLKNPFPWNDASSQAAGKGLYRQYCLACHGIKGNSLATSDFSDADYAQKLETGPDVFFRVLSEGELSKGMPPYKSSLSQDQRWQVLTYLWSLGAGSAPPKATPPTKGESGLLLLTAPKQAQAGQPLTLTATLGDSQASPIKDAAVKFFIKVDFFASSLMEVGEAITNDQGVAVLQYTPRLSGDIQVVARYEANETATIMSLAGNTEPFYRTEVGLRLPAIGGEVFIGPKIALEARVGSAPLNALWLPGGTFSWLLFLVAAVMLVWFTYLRVMYRMFHISAAGGTTGTNTKLIPLLGMVFVVAMGILLVLKLMTGPYSHLHLLGG